MAEPLPASELEEDLLVSTDTAVLQTEVFIFMLRVWRSWSHDLGIPRSVEDDSAGWIGVILLSSTCMHD